MTPEQGVATADTRSARSCCVVGRLRNLCRTAKGARSDLVEEANAAMGWFIAVLVIAYFVGVRIVARRYFARRHGVSLEQGEPGGYRAAMVGAAWPVTAWLAAVRHPQQCSHHRHVLQHARLVQEIELVEQLKQDRAS
jgi:hypothetical protein